MSFSKFCYVILGIACLLNGSPEAVFAQGKVEVVGRGKTSGTVTAVKSGTISIKSSSDETTNYLLSLIHI